MRSIITLGSLNKSCFLLIAVIGASIDMLEKKVEACHLGTISSSVSPCHLTEYHHVHLQMGFDLTHLHFDLQSHHNAPLGSHMGSYNMSAHHAIAN